MFRPLPNGWLPTLALLVRHYFGVNFSFLHWCAKPPLFCQLSGNYPVINGQFPTNLVLKRGTKGFQVGFPMAILS
jgi:hypothetical protein